MKLSIIIPVYNVDKYLQHCLDSCLKQDEDDYEIIIVDDGSPDQSLSIIQEYASKYPRIKYISQENQGLSVARNSGLRIAIGDYIWFVDSDDWIESDCLSHIFTELNGIDILQLQYRKIYDNSKYNKDIYFIVDGMKTGQEILKAGSLPTPAQFCIYRRDFLLANNLCFTPGIYHEDSEFKPRAVYWAKSIKSIDKVCYNYYQRTSGSITSSFKIKNAVDLLYVMNNLYSFSKDKDEEIQRAFYVLIGLDMNSLLFIYWQLNSSDKKKIRKQLGNNRHLFLCMQRCKNIKYKVEGLVLTFSVGLGLFLHKLLRMF